MVSLPLTATFRTKAHLSAAGDADSTSWGAWSGGGAVHDFLVSVEREGPYYVDAASSRAV